MKDPSQILEPLSGPLLPIQQLALRFMGSDSSIDPISGALCISRRPKIAPAAHALRAYPGITETLISSYEEIHGCHIHPVYRELLQRMNGAHLFELTLFGIPPAMAKRPPQVNRSTVWPLDIATAQQDWRRDYNSAPSDFLIGYGPDSDQAPVGYFLGPNAGLEALRPGGDSVGQWGSFDDFLTHELARAEAAYPNYEREMQRILRSSSRWRGWLHRLVNPK